MARRRYRAFISYSHQDERWGAWLHRALETYRVPPRLVGRRTDMGEVPTRIRPVFRDREELPTATELGEVINRALADSDCLIVVCSPRAARSRWVNEEILTFKRLGRANRILCLIVAGEPNASDKPDLGREECFPEALRFRMDDDGELTDEPTEPIAADARAEGDGKQNAKLKLLAGVLGVDYDDLRQREQQRRQRRLVAIAAASLAGLALTSGLAVNAYLAQQEAERERGRAEVEAETAQRTSEFLVSLFQVSDPGEARGNSITAREILDAGAERIETELADQPDVQLRLMQTIGSVYRALGLYEDARRLLTGALEETVRAHGETDLRTASIKADLAYLLNLDGTDPERSDELGREALATFRDVHGADSLDVANLINALAFGWVKAGRNAEEAVELLNEALSIQRAGLDAQHPDIAGTLFHLGWATGQAGDQEEARRLYEEALAIRRTVYGDTHPSLGWSLNNLGHLEIALGNPAQGKAYCTEALAVNRRLFEGLHNEQGFNLRCIAWAEQELGNLPAALAAAEESVHVLRETLPQSSPEVAHNLGRLADILGDLGRAEEALQRRREAVTVYRSAGDGARSGLGSALNNLAYQESMAGMDEAAREHYAEAVAVQRALYGDVHRHLVIPLSNLAAATLKLGDAQAAEAPLREAIGIAREVNIQPAWIMHMLDLNLGEILLRQGNMSAACELTESAEAGLNAELGGDHFRVGVARSVHGHCLAVAGRPGEESLPFLESGLEILLGTRPAGESRRIEALERLVEASELHNDEERRARYQAALESERSAAP